MAARRRPQDRGARVHRHRARAARRHRHADGRTAPPRRGLPRRRRRRAPARRVFTHRGRGTTQGTRTRHRLTGNVRRYTVRRRPSFIYALALATLGAAAVSAFDVPTHRAITLDKLKDLTATVGGKTVKFSQRALEEIAQANEDTDDTSSAALFHPERHFTNERFLQGTTELMTQRQKVI